MKLKLLISRVKIIAAILAVTTLTLAGQDIPEKYLVEAAQNNPALKARFSEYMASLERIPQVKALPDPQLAFGYFITPVQTRTGPQEFKISGSQMFPWFGTLKLREDAATEQAKAMYELFEEARSDLFHQVRSAYYDIIFNRRAITVTSENIGLLESFRNLVNTRIEAGRASLADEYRIEIEIGDLRNELSLLEDQSAVLLTRFISLLNSDTVSEVIVPDTIPIKPFVLSREQILDSIYANNHLLLSLDRQVESLGYKSSEAEKNGLPQISIGFDYTVTGRGENNMAGTDAFMFPRIGITVPVYRKKQQAMVREALYLQEARSGDRDNRLNILTALFEKGWKEYHDGERRIDLYRQQGELASGTLELLITGFTTGKRDFEDVLSMERRLLKYSLELERARTDRMAAISFIYYLMGN